MNLSDREHNKRLINVLAFRVACNTMCEVSAMTIAKDSWKTITGSFTSKDEVILNRMWDKHFDSMLKLEQS
jgi:hypothetical protein